MSVFPPVSSPRVALRDLRAFLRQRSREQVIAAALSILITTIIIIIFMVDAKINTAPPPTITYVQNYAPGRTDADIIADQRKDQAEKDAFKKAKQKQFQELEKRFGIE
ncbi:MAG TPA: hypothetical protein VHM21_01165 [Sphingomicrobium sp.]|jgi:hypothetical protein|nr:hypothetical protein [Sphingomicrobium sp.]